jgi:SSS family solute:Na+ symporter
MVLASLAATYIGPGFSLGLAAKAHNSGFFFILFFAFFSLQTIVVGVWLAPRLRKFSTAHTLGDIMRELYGKEAQILTGLLSVGLCVGFTAVLGRAGGSVFAQATGLSLPLSILVATGVAVTYTYTGGMKSVIGIEAIQFGIIVLSCSLVLLFSANRVSSFHALDIEALGLTRQAWGATSKTSIVGLILSFALGETLIPPYANRAMAAKSESSSRTGFILAGMFSMVWFAMMVASGMIARVVISNPSDNDAVLVSLASSVLPHGLIGLFLVAVAAIVMSTQEALLNSAAVSLTRDIFPRLRATRERSQLTVAKAATLIFGVLAIWLALKAPSIIDGLLICYSLWATTVLPPLVWGVLGFPANRWSGVLSMICGGMGTGVILLGKIAGGDPAHAVIVGLVSSIVGGIVGMAFRSRTKSRAASTVAARSTV